jgi:hypothetical protein
MATLAAHLTERKHSGRAADIVRADIVGFVGTQLKRNSAGTASHRYRALVQFFRWLEDDGEVSPAPTTSPVGARGKQ